MEAVTYHQVRLTFRDLQAMNYFTFAIDYIDGQVSIEGPTQLRDFQRKLYIIFTTATSRHPLQLSSLLYQ